MDRLEWLTARQSGIGASDSPDLLGVGWGDAGSVYRSKVEPPVATLPKSGVLRRGIELERLVMEAYAREMGLLVEPGTMERHPARTWQLASIDCMAFPQSGGPRPVQLKTVAGFGEAWGPAGTEDVPENYAVQCQHEMGVVEADCCDLAALDVIAWELRVYRLEFRPDFFAWLTGVEERFYRDHLLPRRPPGPEWQRNIDASHKPPTVQRGMAIDLGPTAAEFARRRAVFAAIEREAGAEKDAITEVLKQLMGDAETATAGEFKLRRTTIPGGPVSYERKDSVRLDCRAAKVKELE